MNMHAVAEAKDKAARVTGVLLVWLDHASARIYRLDENSEKPIIVEWKACEHHTHNKKDNRDHEPQHLFKELTNRLDKSGKILLCGPGKAKHEFLTWLEKHGQGLGNSIVGTETVDHPSDAQLIAFGKKYFQL